MRSWVLAEAIAPVRKVLYPILHSSHVGSPVVLIDYFRKGIPASANVVDRFLFSKPQVLLALVHCRSRYLRICRKRRL